MPYYSIEQIQVEGNPNGKAWGGYIFGATLSIGFDSAPSQLSLNIISPTGVYTISNSDLTFESAVSIKFGNISGSPLEIKMFPVKYEISKSGEQKSLVVTYLDRSKILDRVFVGRLNEHTRRNVQTVVLTADIPVACPSCDGSPHDRRFNYTTNRQIETLGFNANVSTLQFRKVGFTVITSRYSNTTNGITTYYHAYKSDPSFDPSNAAYQFSANQQIPINYLLQAEGTVTVGALTYSLVLGTEIRKIHAYFDYVKVTGSTPIQGYKFGDTIKGGFIGIGTEEFSQSTCSSSAVSYSLQELKTLIRDFGISIGTVTVGSNTIDTIPDGVNHIRRSYAGTLREVLLQWGSEYGFSFTYDFMSHTIIGLDRRNPILSLSSIKTAVYAADNLADIAGSPIIESLVEEASIEDTSKNYYVTAYKRDQKVKKATNKIFNQAFFYRLTLSDVMTLPAGFANYTQLYIACVLAKYFGKSVWEHYLINQGVLDVLLSIGAASSGSQEKLKAVNLSFNAYDLIQADGNLDFVEELYKTHSGMADFINSFYYHVGFTPSNNTCCRDTDPTDAVLAPTLKFQLDSHFDEKVETFYPLMSRAVDCQTAPLIQSPTFSNAIPSYAKYFGKYNSLLRGVESLLNTKFPLGHNHQSVSFFDRPSNYSIFANFQEQSEKSQQKVYSFTSSQATSLLNKNIKVIAESVLTNGVSVSFNTQSNPAESVKPNEVGSYECKLKCEENISSQACDPVKCIADVYQRVDKPWQKGLLDNVGDLFSITLVPQAVNFSPTLITIISPSNAPYQGNFMYEQDLSYVIPGAKQMIEKFNTYPGNVGRVSAVVNDVTADLDAFFDANGGVVAQVFVPEKINNNHVVTVQDYDAQIRLDNQLVEASLNSPTERFLFTVPGILDHSSITIAGDSILRPEKGLTSINISLSDKGVSSSYTFATRPPTPPPQFSQLTWNKIGAKFII